MYRKPPLLPSKTKTKTKTGTGTTNTISSVKNAQMMPCIPGELSTHDEASADDLRIRGVGQICSCVPPISHFGAEKQHIVAVVFGITSLYWPSLLLY